MKKMLALTMALTILTGCDLAQHSDVRSDRDDGQYRTAMDDYRAGRIEAAAKGFREVLVRNPLNASARFQLACLLQDSRQDFVGAYCCYREYLLQQPDSDKAKLARERMALCEKESAKELATKYGLNSAGAAAQNLARVQDELKTVQGRAKKLEADLSEAQRKLSALSDERDRLVKVVKGVGDGVAEAPLSQAAIQKEAKDLLEEDDETPSPVPAGELVQIRKDMADEESAASPLPAPAETPQPKGAEAKDKKEVADKGVPERPKTYQVQEGDTLYGVAKRFYGSISVWKQIREANKAVIPMDNRLRAGDTIVLP